MYLTSNPPDYADSFLSPLGSLRPDGCVCGFPGQSLHHYSFLREVRVRGGRVEAQLPAVPGCYHVRGRASPDTEVALPSHLLGSPYVVVTPSLQPKGRHRVCCGGLTPASPASPAGRHAAHCPPSPGHSFVYLESFQALQVQSAEGLSRTRIVPTYPVALLAGHSCLQAGDRACGHVAEQLPLQGCWSHVYAVHQFAPAGSELETCVRGGPRPGAACVWATRAARKRCRR